MKFVPPFLLAAALCVCSPSSVLREAHAASGDGVSMLTNKLRSEDFRVRVQAALLLGKSGDAQALPALVSRLADDNVAVRAASAAALGMLGDPAALPALRRNQEDSSQAVRRRVASSIRALEDRQRSQIQDRRRAKILVKFHSFRSSNLGGSPEALGVAALSSRRTLERMPDVAVLNATEDPQQASRRHDRPVLLVRPMIRRLASTKEGESTVVMADIEFVVERYPEQSIIGRLSGNARAQSRVDSRRAELELQEEALDAAIASALGSSETALVQAAGHG